MLEVIGSSLIALLMEILGQEPVKLETVPLLSWQEAEIFALPTEPDPIGEAIIEDYIKSLSAKGIAANQQGVWIQSDWTELAQHQGTVPASAASLTKIATTLAALENWGADYRFETRIYATGSIQEGVLQGDLIVSGGGDPLFVWEEAIALGNALNQLGIRQVTGNLAIIGNFSMNYQSNPRVSGQLLKQGLNARLWSPAAVAQYRTLPQGTPRPQVAIAGTVIVQESLPDPSQLLVRHQSMTLAQILQQMNIYSNNAIAQMLAQSVGGATVVSAIAAKAVGVSGEEIQLINGSGLGIDNRISPRAVCGMLIAIERKLHSQPLSVTDLFPVAGRERLGTMKGRNIPSGIAIKTGTLNQVSALAGMIPTSDRGSVWFAIINHGYNIEQFRTAQDQLLQRFSQHWQVLPVSTTATTTKSIYLGDPSRNLKVDG